MSTTPLTPVFPSTAMCTEGWFDGFGPDHASLDLSLASHRQVTMRTKEIGFSAVELVAATILKNPMALTEEICREYAALFAELGMPAISLHWLLLHTKAYLTDPTRIDETVETLVHLARVILCGPCRLVVDADTKASLLQSLG